MSSDRKVPDDHELEDFLAGRHPVGRAYRAVSEHETAPRELDDAILRMAREHAATTTPTARVTRRPRWLQPLAVAATLALSLGVLMNIWRDPALREQVAAMEEGGEEAVSADAVGAETSSTAQPATAREIAQPIEAAKPMRDESVGAREPQEQKRSATLESRRAEPLPAEDAGLSTRQLEDRLDRAISPSAVSPRSDSAMAPPPAPPRAPSTSPSAPAAQASGAAPSRPDVDPRVLEREDPSFDFYSLTPHGGPARAERVQEKKRSETDDSRALAKQKSSLGKSMASDAVAPGEAESANKEERGTRDVLIERARAAVARGDTQEARRLVAELRRLYPDTPLPDDLRPLAPPAP